MLCSPEAIAKAVTLVAPSDLYRPVHATIFAAIETLHARGEKADAVTVADECRQLGAALEDPGLLVHLLASTPNFTQVGHYGQIVVRHSTSRRLMGLASDAGDRLAAYADPYELADELQAKLGQLDLPVTSDRQQGGGTGRGAWFVA
jgi:replicative DNA helicase